MSTIDPTQHPVRIATDIVAATGIFASIMDWLPRVGSFIATTLGIIWFLIQIWESNTVQKALIGWRRRRHAKILAVLKAREKVTVAKIAEIEAQRQALDEMQVE